MLIRVQTKVAAERQSFTTVMVSLSLSQNQSNTQTTASLSFIQHVVGHSVVYTINTENINTHFKTYTIVYKPKGIPTV